MNEHMSTSRVEQLKHIESKVRRYHKKFQADRQSFVVGNRVWKGFRATGIIIVFHTRIDDLSEGSSWIAYEATREEQSWEQGVQESQVLILWNWGLWAHHVG